MITGILEQDGGYLARLLLYQGHRGQGQAPNQV